MVAKIIPKKQQSQFVTERANLINKCNKQNRSDPGISYSRERQRGITLCGKVIPSVNRARSLNLIDRNKLPVTANQSWTSNYGWIEQDDYLSGGGAATTDPLHCQTGHEAIVARERAQALIKRDHFPETAKTGWGDHLSPDISEWVSLSDDKTLKEYQYGRSRW